MSTETTNGTPLRDLTPTERKAVDLRARGALDAAIRIETAKPGAKAERAAIRAWARMHGLGVADRGVLPDSVVTAYHAADGGEPQ